MPRRSRIDGRKLSFLTQAAGISHPAMNTIFLDGFIIFRYEHSTPCIEASTDKQHSIITPTRYRRAFARSPLGTALPGSPRQHLRSWRLRCGQSARRRHFCIYACSTVLFSIPLRILEFKMVSLHSPSAQTAHRLVGGSFVIHYSSEAQGSCTFIARTQPASMT